MSELETLKKKLPTIPMVFSNERILREIESILRVPTGTRNIDELRKLSQFLENCKIFKNIRDPIKKRELCNCLKLVECYEGEVICRQGDIGTTFYIILQGAVNGFIAISTAEQKSKGDTSGAQSPMISRANSLNKGTKTEGSKTHK